MKRYMREFLDVMYPENPGNKVAQEPAIIDATRLIRRLRTVLSAAQYQLEVEETAHDAVREKLAYYRDTLCIGGDTMVKLTEGAEAEIINVEKVGDVLDERDQLRLQLIEADGGFEEQKRKAEELEKELQSMVEDAAGESI